MASPRPLGPDTENTLRLCKHVGVHFLNTAKEFGIKLPLWTLRLSANETIGNPVMTKSVDLAAKPNLPPPAK